MRDEDLKALPQSIDRHRFSELMQEVGFKAGWENHTKEMWLDRDGLHVVVYATDENGKRYFSHTPTEIEVTDLSEKEPQTVRGPDQAEAATHEISIPFTGDWKPRICGDSALIEGVDRVCRLPRGHDDLHDWSSMLTCGEAGGTPWCVLDAGHEQPHARQRGI